MKRISGIFIFFLFFASSAQAARLPEGDLLDGVQAGADGNIDILLVFAHQDDESIYGGGAVLKALKDPRARLHILCLTLGDLSEARDHLSITGDHLGRIRSEELETAAEVYGAEEVIQFTYHDQGLESADLDRLIEEIREVIDRVGAEIVVTHGPLGVTGHPDHMTCSRAATEAFNLSGAKRLYYPTLSKSMRRLAKMVGLSSGQTPAEPAEPTFRVDIREVKKLKRMACYAHASQMHFSDVGLVTDLDLLFDHEYFELAAEK